MLTKFETKSNRVKGLAFHPQRPWILASLHNGSIQMWDYRMGTLIDRYEEHEGPVRGVDFHKSQPLFVSGGDDYKIKVWNYKLRRCIFTLMGHLDYIRTVYFHPDSPWIVSASDDQTVRVWDWQQRQCLTVLTGHNHYVMSASFHPSEDLIVSASLDQTIRVWDISSLRDDPSIPGPPGSSSNQTLPPLTAPGSQPVQQSGSYGPPGIPGSAQSLAPSSSAPRGRSSGPQSAAEVIAKVKGKLPAAVNADLFGTSDAIVKYVLEGHSRGVNWASFHPTLPLIISGADDRQVKLWRMSDTKAWEVDTFRGHLNNVSCAIFHPHQELVISCSEDKTIKVWDLNRRACIHTFRREADRFWITAAHPSINLLSAGHDSGMLVFKLERERPAYAAAPGSLVYLKDQFLRTLDYDNGRDQPLMAVRTQPQSSIFSGGYAGMFGDSSNATSAPASAYQPPPRAMSYNPAEKAALLSYDAEGGSYELYVMPKTQGYGEAVIDPRRGIGRSPTFVGRNRFATLEKGKTVVIRDLHNEVTKRVPLNVPGADAIFTAGSGYCLVRNEERIILFDLQQRKSVSELQASNIKYVAWSDDNSRVALLGKHSIVIATRKLEHLTTLHETIRVKSAAWDDSGVLLYTTLNHLKYCLPNGDSGTVSTLQNPIYLTRVRGPAICYLDRDGNPGLMPIDPTEYAFKLLLLRKRYDDVKRMIAENRLSGQAIISYLHQKGFPEVALHFVKDEATRFSLALDSGAIDVALEAAHELNDQHAWRKLASVAMRQGNLDIVELCYKRTKDLEKLAFLYVISGNFDKLQVLSKLAEGGGNGGNMMARFQIALFLGDVEARIRVLADCGQLLLAKLTAKTHGLTDVLEELGGDDTAPTDNNGSLIMPPIPVAQELNWPMLPVARGLFARDPHSDAFEEPSANYYEDPAAGGEPERDNDWDDEQPGPAQLVDPFAAEITPNVTGGASGDGAWGDDMDFDIPGDEGGAGADPAMGETSMTDEFGRDERESRGPANEYYVPPVPGNGLASKWARKSCLAGELAAAGAAEEAVTLLKQQIGAKSFKPMKQGFLSCFSGCRGSLPGVVNMEATDSFFSRKDDIERPCVPLGIVSIREMFKSAGQLFTGAKFADSLMLFRSILASIPLVVVESGEEVREVREILVMAKEYVTGITVEMKQREAKQEGASARQMQLAGLFTVCRLAQSHTQLTLRAAMKAGYDTQNFITAAGFARRLLDTSPNQTLAASARKMIQYCDKNMTNKDEVDFDDRRDFTINCGSFEPMYSGSEKITCPYCGSVYGPSNAGQTCVICEIGEVGKTSEGLRISMSQLR